MRISREHGHYLTTAITEVMGLGPEYLDAFAYVYDVYMPMHEKYHFFIADYELYGPECGDKLRLAENREYCSYLLTCYLMPFVVLVQDGEIEEAIALYQKMFNEVKRALVIPEPAILELRS